MGRRSGEIPLSPEFQPPDAADGFEFSAAQLALIGIAQGQSDLSDPVDALKFALVQRERAERRQRQVIDEIIAAVGREKREGILAAEAAELGVSQDELRELLANPPEYRALMEMKAQAHLGGVETAKQFLADHRRRTAEQNEAALDRWGRAFNKSKPGRGDRHYGMNQLGEMVAAEMIAEKKMRAAARKLQQAERSAPERRKPTWKQKLAPGAKKAWLHFEQTGRGIVGEVINQEPGKAAEILELERQLELWDKKREEGGLDFAGFPWPKDED